MSKKKKQEEGTMELKPFIVTSGTIKDDLCNYSYEVKHGIGIGDVVKVAGKGIIDEDMRIAFYKLSVHLGIVDDVFKHAGIQLNDLKEARKHDLSKLYLVTGFKIKGSEENERVILIGTKQVDCSNGEMAIESPEIEISRLSSYTWAEELREAVEEARTEIELYRGGKYTVVDAPAESDPNQLTIVDTEASLEHGKVE